MSILVALGLLAAAIALYCALHAIGKAFDQYERYRSILEEDAP